MKLKRSNLTREEKRERRRERAADARAWLPVVILLIALGVIVWNVLDSNADRAAQSKANTAILKNVEDLLTFTTDISSPEAQAENTRRTTELIRVFATQLQCDNRDALQEVHSKKWNLRRRDAGKKDAGENFPSLKAAQESVRHTVPLLDHAEVVALARGIVTNQIFFTNTEEGIKNSFGMLITFGAFADWEESELMKFAGAYAPIDTAMPRAINGWPMFMQMKCLHVDNSDELFDEIARMEDALGLPHRVPDTDKEGS